MSIKQIALLGVGMKPSAYLSALSPKGVPAYLLFIAPMMLAPIAIAGITTESELTTEIDDANTAAEDNSSYEQAFTIDNDITLTSDLDTFEFNATFNDGSASGVTISGGDLTSTGGHSLLFDDTVSFTGNITLLGSGASLTLGSETGFGGASTVNGSNVATLIYESNNNRTVDSSFWDTFINFTSFEKQGNGTLILSDAFGLNIDLDIQDGTLQVTDDNQLDDAESITVASGATLDLNSTSQSLASLAGAGDVLLGSDSTTTLTIGSANTDTTFSGDLSGTGDILKTGEGSLTISGDVDVTGTFTIEGEGSLTLSGENTTDVVALDESTLTLRGEQTGDVTASDSSSVNISADTTGNITVTDEVSLTLSGDLTGNLTADQTSIVNSSGDITGNINLSDDVTANISGDLEGDLTAEDNTTLTLNASVEGDVNITDETTATISGQIDGNVLIEGDGVVTLNSTITGDVSVSGTSSDLDLSIASAIEGDLSLAGTGETTYTGSIEGNTSLYGQVDFITDGGYFDGDLLISSNANFIVDSASTITGDVTHNGTIDLSDNSSSDTLTIEGDYTIGSGATLTMDIGSDGSSDVIASDGSITIKGGQLSLVSDSDDEDDFSLNTSYTLLTADDGITGTFDTVDLDLNFVDAELTYEDESVDLTLVRNDVSFTEKAATDNQTQVASALESIDELEGALSNITTTLLSTSTNSAAQEIYDQLSGANLATAVSAQLDIAKSQPGLISQQLSPYQSSRSKVLWKNKRRTTTTETTRGNWAFVGDSDLGILANYTLNTGEFGNDEGIDYSGGTMSVGVSKRLSDAWLVGGVVGVGQYDLDFLGDQSGTVESDTLSAHGFAQHRRGSWFFNGVAGLTLFSNDSSRTVVIDDSSGAAEASFDATAITALLEAGRIFEFSTEQDGSRQQNPLNLQPFASAQYTNLSQDGYSESGIGNAGLDVESSDLDSLELGLGVRAFKRLPMGMNNACRIQGSLGLAHDLLDPQASLDVAFAETSGTNMQIDGSDIGSTRIQAGVGVAFDLGNSFTLGADAEVSFGSDRDNLTVRGGFGWTF